MRTFTRRKLTALAWQETGPGKARGIIKAEIYRNIDDPEPDPELTRYYAGEIQKTDQPYKDALKIIENQDNEITKEEATKLIERNHNGRKSK